MNLSELSLIVNIFEGHFLDNPIVPGVVIVEAMAQTAGVVVSDNLINAKDRNQSYL